MIALCFFILPFTYFYAEEALSSDDDIDNFFENNNSSDSDEEETRDEKRDKEKGRSRSENWAQRIMEHSGKAIRHTVSLFSRQKFSWYTL